MNNNKIVLKSLIDESKDGEWGKSEPFENSIKMFVIRGTDFEDVRVGMTKKLPIRYIPSHIANRKTLQPNDLILETAGGSKDRPTGRVLFVKSSLIKKAELPFICASFSRFIRISSKKAYPEYVFWLLEYLYNAGHIRKYHTQHTGVARFQYTTFAEREELNLPPLPLQHKIAAILSAYDDLIENNTRRIQILEEMARMIYQEWFVKFRFPGYEQAKFVESPIRMIPEGWEVSSIGEITSLISRGVSPKYEENANGVVINQKCIRDSKVNLDLARKHITKVPLQKYIRFGDVLINSTGVGTLGRVAQFYQEFPECTVDSHVTIARANKKVTYEYFGYLMETLQDTFDRLGFGATGQTELSRDSIAKIEVLLPDLNIQQIYSKIISPVLKQIQTLIKKNENLKQTRDLLLPKLISGELDVSDLDIAIER